MARYPGGIIRSTSVTPTLSAASGIWTLREALQAQAQGIWPIANGNDQFTKLLLHFDGADGSTTLTNSAFSGVAAVTANGNAQIDTAQSKFGGASLLLDGTGDFASVADSADWAFATGDFTIDCWVRPNSTGDQTIAFWTHRLDDSNRILFRREPGGDILQLAVISGGSTVAQYSVSWTPTVSTWYHVALVRSGTQIMMFIDGVSQTLTVAAAISTNSMPDIAAGPLIGRDTSAGANVDFNGWFDEFRVSKGIARWTSDFTPPEQRYG